MTQQQENPQEQPQARPAPGRGGNMLLSQAGSGAKPKISPIWLLIALTVLAVGIIFGQALVPAPSMAQSSTMAATPAPAVTEPAYGARHANASADPNATATPAASSPPGAPGGVRSPQPNWQYQQNTYTDPRIAYDQNAQNVLRSVTSAAQVPGINPSALVGGNTGASSSSAQIVQVYSDTDTAKGVTAIAAGTPSSWAPPSPPPPQEVTSAGDMQGTGQGTLVQGRANQYHFDGIPDVVTTPMPYMVPAGTGIRTQFDMPVDSDLTGDVRIHVLQGYCDPRNGALVIPPGSWLLGKVKRLESDRHLDFTWYRFTYPDLSSRPLLDVSTLDEEGHTGVAGRKVTHSWQIFRDSVIASVANEAGTLLNTALSHANSQSNVTVVAPGGQSSGGGYQQQAYTPTVEIARSTPLTVYLEADFGSDRPYDLPGWHGCSPE